MSHPLKSLRALLAGAAVLAPPALALPTNVTLTPPEGSRFLTHQRVDLRVEGQGTPGSTGYLFALSTGVRVLYVGDAAWEHRGVDQPVQKNPLVPIDADLQATGDTLGRLHAAQRDNADLQILTAHDFAGWYRLPMCREFAPRPQANRMP